MAAPATSRTVVIAVDEHQHSKTAFDWFLSNVYRKDDLVIICHVPEAPNLPTFSIKHGIAPPVDEWHKAMTEKLDKIKKLEEGFEAELIQRKIQYRVRLESGPTKAGPSIVGLAEHEGADLVVMGTRGLDALKRAFLGSVSEYVVRNASMPVLICPTPKKA